MNETERTSAELSEVRRIFLWQLLSRENPLYRPRRKAATAWAWARAIKHVCLYLSGVDRDLHLIRQWAARTVLDFGSDIELPPGYEALQVGSLRRQANDAGGIEGQVLMVLAGIVVDRYCHRVQCIPARTWGAWMMLYPSTAEPEISEVDEIVDEWDLVYSAYELPPQVEVTWSDEKPDFSRFDSPRVTWAWGMNCNGQHTRVHFALDRGSVGDPAKVLGVHLEQDGFTAPEMTECVLRAIKDDGLAVKARWDDPEQVLMDAIDRTVHQGA